MYVLRVQVWYDPNDVFDAWDLYLAAAEADSTLMKNKLFRYSILPFPCGLPYILKNCARFFVNFISMTSQVRLC